MCKKIFPPTFAHVRYAVSSCTTIHSCTPDTHDGFLYAFHVSMFIFVMQTHLSVPYSLVISFWEMSVLFALLCFLLFCQSFPLCVPGQVWYLLYRFLIFAFLSIFSYHFIKIGTPRVACVPLLPKNNALISPNPFKNFLNSLKVILLCSPNP